MNIARVFLHNLVWEKDHDAFLDRMDNFLTIADKHHIEILFVLFDDCWNSDPNSARSPIPSRASTTQAGCRRLASGASTTPPPGVRSSSMRRPCSSASAMTRACSSGTSTTSPATVDRRSRTGTTPSRSSSPCSNGLAKPSPPSRSPSMSGGPTPISIADAWDNSDVINAHEYADRSTTEQMVKDMKLSGRPVIFTEWMALPRNSTFANNLAMFKQYNVGNICWGFVAGKTNTIFPWGSKEGTPEPASLVPRHLP